MTRVERPTFKHHAEHVLAQVLGRAVALLPIQLTANIALLAGIVVGRLIPVRRKVVEENLRIAFGNSIDSSERRRLMREAYKSLALLIVESAYLRFARPQWTSRRVVEGNGEEVIAAAHATGRPVITISGHVGNWEILGGHAARLLPVTTLAKSMHNRLFQEDVRKSREAQGLQIVWSDSPNAVRSLLKASKDKSIVHFFIDQDMRHEGIFVPFFGRPASTMTIAATMAIRTQALVVPSFLIRLGPTRHRWIARPPIDAREYADGDRDEQVRRLTERLTREIEDVVRLYPAQYFWFHRRWKTTPESTARRERSRARKKQRSTSTAN